jgi:hypothetical protein
LDSVSPRSSDVGGAVGLWRKHYEESAKSCSTEFAIGVDLISPGASILDHTQLRGGSYRSGEKRSIQRGR